MTWLSRRFAQLAALGIQAGVAMGILPLAHAGASPGLAPRDVANTERAIAVTIPEVPAHFEQRDLGWLRLAYTPHAARKVEELVREADDAKAKLAEELGQRVLKRVEVRIARTAEEMGPLAPPELPPPPYASGVAYPGLALVVLTLASPDAIEEPPDLAEVFRHELAHIALDDAVGTAHVPRWFNEGLAIYVSGESRWARTRTLWEATLSKTVLPLAELDGHFPTERSEVNIAYAQAADFVRFLMRKADRARFIALIDRVREGEPFERAIADAYGADLRKLEYQWSEDNGRRYTLLPLLSGGSLLWVLLIAVMAVGYVRKRREARATLARWEHEEAAVDQRAALADRAPPGAPPSELPVVPQGASLPKIEHEGRWHTLH